MRTPFPVALAILLFGTGCAGTHLYQQAQHELATKTATAFKEANIGDALAGERQLMQTLAANEQAIVRRQMVAVRNAELKAIVGRTGANDGLKRLKAAIEARIAALSSLSESNQIVVITADDTKAEREKVAELLEGDTKPLGASYRMIRAIETTKETATAELKQAKAAYDAAKKAYDSASSVFNPAGQTLKELSDGKDKVKEAAENLKAALDKLGAKGNLEGKLAALEEKESAVMAVLSYLASTNLNASVPTNTIHGALASFLPVLKREGNKIFAPQVSHLLLVQENLRLQRDEAARQIERQETRLRLLKEKAKALNRELTYLLRARAALAPTLDNTGRRAPIDPPVSPGFAVWIRSNPSSASSRAVTEALMNYGIAWTVGRVQQELADYKLIALGHDEALDGSEFALQRWQNLIGIPIKQLEAYHAAGIKPETIAELIGAASITSAIGAK